MPFFLSFASFANGLAWTAYALIRFDPFITVINDLNLILKLQLINYNSDIKLTQYISSFIYCCLVSDS